MDEHTSARAALELDRLGVKGVKALAGGLADWSAANYPLATGNAPGRQGAPRKR